MTMNPDRREPLAGILGAAIFGLLAIAGLIGAISSHTEQWLTAIGSGIVSRSFAAEVREQNE